MNRILILGMGNTVMGDDGVGVRVVEYLREIDGLPENVELIDGGTSSFDLVPEVVDSDVTIIVDAVVLSDAAPGTVRCLVDDDADGFLRSTRRTAHEVGLAEIVDLARLSGWTPRHWAIVGIQFASVASGIGLSDPVAAAVEPAARTVIDLIGTMAVES